MSERKDFFDVVEMDTAWRLDFSDDFFPSLFYQLPDGTHREIFDACPHSSCYNDEPSLALVVAKDQLPDGTTKWYMGSITALHPGSFRTSEEQWAGYYEPLIASLTTVEPDNIDQMLRERYESWRGQAGQDWSLLATPE